MTARSADAKALACTRGAAQCLRHTGMPRSLERTDSGALWRIPTFPLVAFLASTTRRPHALRGPRLAVDGGLCRAPSWRIWPTPLGWCPGASTADSGKLP